MFFEATGAPLYDASAYPLHQSDAFLPRHGLQTHIHASALLEDVCLEGLGLGCAQVFRVQGLRFKV